MNSMTAEDIVDNVDLIKKHHDLDILPDFKSGSQGVSTAVVSALEPIKEVFQIIGKVEGYRHLLGLRFEQLKMLCKDLGFQPFHGEQLGQWIFQKRLKNFAEMDNIPKGLRAALENCDMVRPRIDAVQKSVDGTRKYRFLSETMEAFEAVYIPEVAKGRSTNTLCISSQTGCAVGCKFCFTASIRRNRDLTASEIVGQVVAVRDDLIADGILDDFTNVVFMGMGEPLLNYDEVVQATRILLEPKGLGFSSRRVTISTSGIVPRMRQLGHDVPTQLAVSLNATTDDIRTSIMPINKKWPLAVLLEAMRNYPLKSRRRITIEYVLLGDINDREEDALRLAHMLRNIPVKINLLPLNPHDRTPYKPPTNKAVNAFQQILRHKGYTVFVRTPRGQDIQAACGQLGESATPHSKP